MKDLIGIIGILVLLLEIYRWLRRKWILRILGQKKKAKKPRKPTVMKPKSELDCRFCIEEKGNQRKPKREKPASWSEQKGRGGPHKKISTAGYFCSNKEWEYYLVREETIHALVGDGSHGKQEIIRDLKCQACGKKFTVRKNTILYRLKTHSGMVEKIL